MSTGILQTYNGNAPRYTGLFQEKKAETELLGSSALEQTRPGWHMAATLYTALGLTFVGSGGVIPAHAAIGLASPTGARVLWQGTREDILGSENVQSPSTMVSNIKAAFGVNVSQLAKLLQVERQTLYLWVGEAEAPRIQPRNRERLKAVHALSVEWNSLCSRPVGKWLENLATDGKSLLDLLSEADLDRSAIRLAMRVVSKRINEEQAGRKELSIAERLRRKGFQQPPEDDMRSTLAGFSGTVSSDK